MAALLKLYEIRSVIKNGSIFNKRRHFNKGEGNERLGGGVVQEVLRHFCFNGSSKRKKVLYKNIMESPKKLIQNKLECWPMPINCTLV